MNQRDSDQAAPVRCKENLYLYGSENGHLFFKLPDTVVIQTHTLFFTDDLKANFPAEQLPFGRRRFTFAVPPRGAPVQAERRWTQGAELSVQGWCVQLPKQSPVCPSCENLFSGPRLSMRCSHLLHS